MAEHIECVLLTMIFSCTFFFPFPVDLDTMALVSEAVSDSLSGLDAVLRSWLEDQWSKHIIIQDMIPYGRIDGVAAFDSMLLQQRCRLCPSIFREMLMHKIEEKAKTHTIKFLQRDLRSIMKESFIDNEGVFSASHLLIKFKSLQ